MATLDMVGLANKKAHYLGTAAFLAQRSAHGLDAGLDDVADRRRRRRIGVAVDAVGAHQFGVALGAGLATVLAARLVAAALVAARFGHVPETKRRRHDDSLLIHSLRIDSKSNRL